jgi:hypothetical protein
LGKFCTIDEMMIRYKGTYCLLRQYMPQKPQKWSIKVWYLACSVIKFVWNFAIYCGKEEATSTIEPIGRGEPKLAHKVVMELVKDIEGKGHVIAMDNFFTSISLFKELAEKAIYATGTLRSNRIGIPSTLKDTKTFSRMPQGTLDWRMHESRSMSSILWKNKKPVLLLSTSTIPIGFPCVPVDTVPRRNGAVRETIPTSPMHVEYTTQNRSHKWWHRIFFFLLDMTVINMFIMYVAAYKTSFAHPRKPMTHLQFRTELCRALLRN